mmetsp:Transcript_12115/g.27976  ORF Transcript_12115/g.27976 Transcript_12115/m.27976 type:complete len:221 (+) Transcript_12115:1977-2639(+)
MWRVALRSCPQKSSRLRSMSCRDASASRQQTLPTPCTCTSRMRLHPRRTTSPRTSKGSEESPEPHKPPSTTGRCTFTAGRSWRTLPSRRRLCARNFPRTSGTTTRTARTCSREPLSWWTWRPSLRRRRRGTRPSSLQRKALCGLTPRNPKNTPNLTNIWRPRKLRSWPPRGSRTSTGRTSCRQNSMRVTSLTTPASTASSSICPTTMTSSRTLSISNLCT